jgi:putative ABC transport system ATP-binding protein
MSEYVVDARDITKTYRMGEIDVHALRGVDIQIASSEVISIMGPSGSGKSTLMNMLGCLDRPTSGDYLLDGESVAAMNDDQLSSIRNRKVGFVFQSFNLLTRQTALSNVTLPMRYAGADQKTMVEKATAALEKVGLGDRVHHKPNELSGGQQQRVAIARALVNDPAIILADEPTGALDSRSGEEIMELLLNMNKEFGTTLIFVTHDPRIGEMTNRTIEIRDGMITGGDE